MLASHAVTSSASPPRARSRSASLGGPTSPIKVDPPITGPAEIIPFPITRRIGFIERAANIHVRYKPESAERYLSNMIRRHIDRLQRLGVSAERAAVDVQSLCDAVGMNMT